MSTSLPHLPLLGSSSLPVGFLPPLLSLPTPGVFATPEGAPISMAPCSPNATLVRSLDTDFATLAAARFVASSSLPSNLPALLFGHLGPRTVVGTCGLFSSQSLTPSKMFGLWVKGWLPQGYNSTCLRPKSPASNLKQTHVLEYLSALGTPLLGIHRQ